MFLGIPHFNETIRSNKWWVVQKVNPDNLTSKEVFQWYNKSLASAVSVIDTAVRALSYGMISLIHTFNPSVIVLGGGLVKHWSELPDKIRKCINGVGMATLVKPVEIHVSDMGSNSGLIGAAIQVWE